MNAPFAVRREGGSQPSAGASHRLLWIYTESPLVALDAATWLETTRELRNSGWQVTLATGGLIGRHFVRGVEVWGIPKPAIYIVGQLIFHARIIGHLLAHWGRYDVVLFHQISAPWLLPLGIVRRVLRARRPLLVMDTRTVPMRDREKSTLRALMLDTLYPFFNHLGRYWVDGQTAITARMAQLVAIPPHQLWGVWPSGVNLERFVGAQQARRWPGPGEPISLIYVGSLHQERNLMTLCRAVEAANAAGKSFRLLIVGDGTDRLALEQFAAQTAGRIQLSPPVPHEQIPGWLAQAHIGVLPFPDEEKFHVSSPIKLFEYIAAGLPILATRIPCHVDVIAEGEYVFWAEHANEMGLLAALEQAWQARAELSAMGDAAAVVAPQWTWAATAGKLSQALEDGLAHRLALQS